MIRKPDIARGLRRLGASMAILSLAGCSGYTFRSGLPADYVVESDSTNGVVLVTVGARPEPILGWNAWSHYEFRSVADPEFLGNVKSAKQHNFGATPGCDDDGLPGECGRLFAFILPSGEYEFVRVVPDLDEWMYDNLHRDYYDTPMDGYRFVIHAGEVAYLGNMLSRICAGAALGRGNRILSAIGNVADRYDRDVPLFINKFPQLKADAINNKTMTGAPWLWRYKDGIDYTPAASGAWPSGCSLEADRVEGYLREAEN